MNRVVFRRFPDGEVIALFPDSPWDNHYYLTTSYMHLGQHGGADYRSIVSSSRPAAESEYGPLLAELRRIGYYDLRLMRRARPTFNNSKIGKDP